MLATYKCAIAITDAIDDLEHLSMWARKFVPFYSIAFGAAATLGSFAIFAPQWIHATKFLMYLDKVCAIFENVETPQVRNLLVSLRNRVLLHLTASISLAGPFELARESTRSIQSPACNE